ncbi:tripartite motif-containing protein 60-like [Microtus oregoni]|uniref:tripartite motif-containing protein 60-like n=1 Tax=Microtus oregoni TaxID=111838 RepID=UPI001BB1747C|nr:tripartite motif-containing protein 60-like [Microtus oregoni]
MDFSTALKNLQEACTCFICSALFRNPVTIFCGHNFCQECLSVCWKDLRDVFPCPICRADSFRRHWHRNPQICNLTDMARELQRPSRRRRRKVYTVCQRHNKNQTIFCIEDQELICPRCRFTDKHYTHSICHVMAAAFLHRKMLSYSMELLKDEVKRCKKALPLQKRETHELRKKIRYKKKEICFEFEKVKLFLQSEHEALLNEIHIEELLGLSTLNECVGTLAEHLSALEDLLKGAQAKHVQTDVAFLASLLREYHKCEKPKLPPLWSFRTKQYGLSLPPQYSGLDRIIKRFRIDMHFDLDSAHPQLVISEDRKSVLYKEERQSVDASTQRFHWPALLGCRSFHSGRCFWEVKVGNKPLWTLGMCQDGFPRQLSVQPSVAEGFWAIGRYSESGYVTCGPKSSVFLPVVQPTRIGIFLDYELGELSFYNMDDRSLLYTFNHSFTSAIWPYFCTGTDPEPLKILVPYPIPRRCHLVQRP